MKARLMHQVEHLLIGGLLFLTGVLFEKLHRYHHDNPSHSRR